MESVVTSPVRSIKHYFSLVKFSHTIFAMPFALIGFTMGYLEHTKVNAGIPFDWTLLVKIVLCMVFARSAAMAFNRYLDRRFDAINPRTAQREIPAGIITPNQALTFTVINCLLFIVTTWFINAACFQLSFIALFVVLFYSYTKRFTALCHIVLGVGLSLSPIGSYLAVTGEFALLPLLFSFAVVTWVSGFDIIYALQDEHFDRTNKLHSIPAAIGTRNSLLVSTILHILSAAFVFWAGFLGHFSVLYWVGAFFYAALLVYQHMLVKPNDLSKVGIAFANTNGVASVVFACFTIAAMIIARL